MNAAPDVAAALGNLLVGIDHVGIAVDDIDSAIGTWTALGWVERHREVNDDQGVDEVMLAAPAGGPELQLLASIRDGSPIATFLAKRGPGLQQLAFEVTDVAAAIERCSAAGLDVVYPDPRKGTAGRQITFIHPRSCGGVLIELIGPRVS